MSHKQIYYSDKYDDELYEYRWVFLFLHARDRMSFVYCLELPNVAFVFRHVMLPKDIAKRVPKSHLMSETEWRNLGVQQSQGWVHYMIHQPGTFHSLNSQM